MLKREATMPGHGNHWEALYDLDTYVNEVLVRDAREARLVDRHPCVDVANGADRTEEVFCLRWGGERLAHDILVVSDSRKGSRFFYSSYPVLLDGLRCTVTLDHFEPWEHGIEAWMCGYVGAKSGLIWFFDTRYYAGSAIHRPGDRVEVSLAGLAYFLRPIRVRSFEVQDGELWEMARQQRLEQGETEAEASRPVEIHLTGAAILLPFARGLCDEAEFQGVIDAIDMFEHDGQKIYRLEIVVMRPDDEDFPLPVFVSERGLDGYVPRLGDDVEGVLWLQGQILGPAA